LRRDDPVPDGGKFGLFAAGEIGGNESIGTGGLLDALTILPPLDKIAALGMDFIPALDTDVIAADTTLAVEQSGSGNPSVVVLDLLEEDDARLSWHLAIP
jgi:hypothetical protein